MVKSHLVVEWFGIQMASEYQTTRWSSLWIICAIRTRFKTMGQTPDHYVRTLNGCLSHVTFSRKLFIGLTNITDFTEVALALCNPLFIVRHRFQTNMDSI